ncbi:TerD family protein [Paenibacillus sp. FSL R7-0302]|uniref:TerD family protein n=1 Tax=Paenibacillus sp. FSL R7-0302 TaxID=2921681 RepID=UPI0030F77F57
MAIELVKRGESVDLLKKDPTLEVVALDLSWGNQTYDGRADFDLDVSVFAVDENDRCKDDHDMVYYNDQYLVHPSGSITHSGDERTGAKVGVDERITIELKKVPDRIKRIIAVVTIYDAVDRRQNFGQVKEASAKIVNKVTNEELFVYDLGEEFSRQTAVRMVEIYRYRDSWKFKAVGEGYESGLAKFVKEFGLSVSGGNDHL